MLMTQSQYAKHRGVSQQAVSKAVRAGKFPLVDNKIDPAIADTAWSAGKEVFLAEPKPKPAATPVTVSAPAAPAQSSIAFVAPPKGSQASEQAALARVRREKIEFEMATARGEWVPARETEQSWAEVIVAARNRLLLIPDGIADSTIRAQVDRLIREALVDIARSPIRVEQVSAA